MMKPLEDITRIMAQSPFFKGISESSLERLARICIPKKLKKRQPLFMEGDQGFAVYLCVSGNVQLFKMNPDGRETVIKVIGPGEIFAEVVLFENDTYPVSAVALKESQVYILPKNDFYGLLNNEAFRNDFIRMLMKKQRYLAGQIQSLASGNVEERLFKFLEDQYGKKREYEITMSKKDIAAAIGVTPETFSRLLTGLSKQGLVSEARKAIRLKRPQY